MVDGSAEMAGTACHPKAGRRAVSRDELVAVTYAPQACTRILIAGVKGTVSVAVGPALLDARSAARPSTHTTTVGPGDVLSLMRVRDPITLRGRGTVALVEVPLECPCASAAPADRPADVSGDDATLARRATLAEASRMRTQMEVRLLPKRTAEKLTWAQGRIAVERTTYQGSPETCDFVGLLGVGETPINTTGALCMGWLPGTEAVAEHVHRESWQILFAIHAAGTFTLNGEPKRLEPGQVVTGTATASWPSVQSALTVAPLEVGTGRLLPIRSSAVPTSVLVVSTRGSVEPVTRPIER